MNLQEEELKGIQQLTRAFNDSKIKLADLELTKQAVFLDIQNIKMEFAKLEQSLVKVYGENAIINMDTGEVTYPETQTEVQESNEDSKIRTLTPKKGSTKSKKTTTK